MVNKRKPESLDTLLSKFSMSRIPTDRGRDVVYIPKEDQTVKTIISKKSTCAYHDNGAIGYVRQIKVGKVTKLVCDECLAAIIRSRILNG